jgi:NAD(P)-dependent dehydrogenase (short-subunit alcohol dehydrogenase family)
MRVPGECGGARLCHYRYDGGALGRCGDFERAIRRHQLRRLGTPEDVADVVAFLCSDGAKFITGQSINASAGFVI